MPHSNGLAFAIDLGRHLGMSDYRGQSPNIAYIRKLVDAHLGEAAALAFSQRYAAEADLVEAKPDV